MNRKFALMLIFIVCAAALVACGQSEVKESAPSAAPTLSATPAASAVPTSTAQVQKTDEPVATKSAEQLKAENPNREVQMGDHLTWPVDMVPNMPMLKGNLKSVVSDSKSGAVNITVEEVEGKDAEAYYGVVRNMFNISLDVSETGNTIFCSGKRGEETILYSYSYSSKVATIIYNSKLPE